MIEISEKYETVHSEPSAADLIPAPETVKIKFLRRKHTGEVVFYNPSKFKEGFFQEEKNFEILGTVEVEVPDEQHTSN